MQYKAFTYPLDPYGTQASNLIVGELHTITPANGSDFKYIVPNATPFFSSSLVVKSLATQKPLSEGVDYALGFKYVSASIAAAAPIYGAIVLLDSSFNGQVSIDYQTLGGEYVLDQHTLLELLANAQVDPRMTTWDQVTDKPYQYAPKSHLHDAEDLIGMDDVVAALEDIVAAIDSTGNKFYNALNEHVLDYNNPHRVTAQQLGLDPSQALTLATQEEAEAGTASNVAMSPLNVTQWYQKNVYPTLNGHLTNTANPHDVTKSQVGLSEVQNYGIATDDDAKSDSSNELYMTPHLTWVAIGVHTAQRNPHGTTAADVGLGNVGNFPFATDEEAQAGTATDRYMSPYLVALTAQQFADAGLATHINDHGNPHQVTADQVGLGNVSNYAIATTQEATDGNSNTAYMTPSGVAAYVATKVGDSYGVRSGPFAAQYNALDFTISGVSYPSYTGTYRVTASTWTPEAEGIMLVMGNKATTNITPGDGFRYYYYFIANSGKTYISTNLDGNGYTAWASPAGSLTPGDVGLGNVVNGLQVLNLTPDLTPVGIMYDVTTSTFIVSANNVDSGTLYSSANPPPFTLSLDTPPTDVTGLAEGYMWYGVADPTEG